MTLEMESSLLPQNHTNTVAAVLSCPDEPITVRIEGRRNLVVQDA